MFLAGSVPVAAISANISAEITTIRTRPAPMRRARKPVIALLPRKGDERRGLTRAARAPGRPSSAGGRRLDVVDGRDRREDERLDRDVLRGGVAVLDLGPG